MTQGKKHIDEEIRESAHPVALRRLIEDKNDPNMLKWDDKSTILYFPSDKEAKEYIKGQGGRGWRYYEVYTHRLWHHRLCECGDCPTNDNPPNTGDNKYKIKWSVWD